MVAVTVSFLVGGCTHEEPASYFPPPESEGGWRKDTGAGFVESLGLVPDMVEQFGVYNLSIDNAHIPGYDYGLHKSAMVIKDGWIVGSVSPPSPKVLELLVQMISQRVGRYLERQGWLVRDIENSFLQLEALDDSAINDLLGHSITYRIAVGPQAGRKAFTLQTVPARQDNDDNSQVAKANGFSLHAGVAAKAHQRRKLERLCRYIARPAVATDRLALTAQGNVRYTLKTPYRDGTTHIILEPLDFIARLAALIPNQESTSPATTECSPPNKRLR